MLQNIRSLLGLIFISLGIIACIGLFGALLPNGLLYTLGIVLFIVFMVYCSLGFLDNGLKFKSRLTNGEPDTTGSQQARSNSGAG